LAESVEVYLDGGPRPLDGSAEGVPSTIVDCTGERLRVVRQGGVSLEALREIVPDILGLGEEPELAEPESTEPESTKPESTEPESTEPESTRPENAELEGTATEATATEQETKAGATSEQPRD
jgi:hypothetical protein